MKLNVSSLGKSFGEQRVLSDVGFSFENIHSLAFIGPSGGGKSTLLRILAGLETPTAGRVEINDRVLVYEETELQKYRKTVGTVFQAYNLFPHLTALANIMLPLEKVHGFSHADARAAAMDFLARFQLESHAHKRPAELSGGQRQRVAIARAVSIKPRLLFFDEPTSALDPEMRAEVLEMIEALRDEGRDFILVTHEMGFARKVADQVAFLAEGRILECSDAQSLFGNPTTPQLQRFLSRILKY
ncbi:MAG TPA: amino acid ABC transporter ATP-binding protein [Chthoniobacterales bacterium]|jgi:polar amino acid transport system ATP-binding protein